MIFQQMSAAAQTFVFVGVSVFVALHVSTFRSEAKAWRMSRNVGDQENAGRWALLMFTSIVHVALFAFAVSMALTATDQGRAALISGLGMVALLVVAGLRRYVRRASLAQQRP